MSDSLDASVLQELKELDRQLQSLLQQRAECARKLTPPGQSGLAAQLLAQRQSTLQGIESSGSEGPLSADSLVRVYRELLAECDALSQSVKVAYLGPQGTYTHAAVQKHFGKSVECIPYTAIDDVFHAVEIGECGYGVVPVENSIEGTINRTLDCITESSLRVCGEVRLRIEHNLLSHAADTSQIESVHAHPQALAQCRRWLESNLPGVKRESASSNAAAAKLAVARHDVAAIAGDQAAELYQLPVMRSNIEDESSNTTRFMVIGDIDVAPTGNDATSLLVSAPHKPGGLRKMLEPFEQAGVSMTRIESRPSKTALWNYVFFIDVSGHQNDDDLVPALAALARETQYCRVLGSYPQALK